MHLISSEAATANCEFHHCHVITNINTKAVIAANCFNRLTLVYYTTKLTVALDVCI